MKFKAKKLDISAGDNYIAIINIKDAEELDFYKGDRIKIKHDRKEIIAIVDTTGSNKLVPPKSIGLFAETYSKLGINKNQNIRISHQEKPQSVFYIKKKLKGKILKTEEINAIIDDITNGKLTDIEMTYFVASTYIHELTTKETIDLTNAIINSGDILKFDKKIIMDKHCIGGVAGNRTTMVVVPIIAAAGLTIPKTSSRSITSPAGTADTMEVLSSVSFNTKQIKKIVAKTNGCMVWGGAVNLAPADDKIIKVEHPVSLDPVGQLLASILAKKKSVSTTHLLIDIPLGKGAKIEKKSEAESLKRKFEIIGKKLGFKILVKITDGKQPIGRGIGPALEAKDVLGVLNCDTNAPKDLREKSIELAGDMLELGGKSKKGKGHILARKLLDSKKAYNKFMEIIIAQGGKKITVNDIKVGKLTAHIKAHKSGIINHINGKIISKIAKIAGAPQEKEAGILLNVRLKNKVKKGDILYTIYSNNKEKIKYAKNLATDLEDIIIK